MSKEHIEKEALLAQVRESRVNNTHLDSRDRHAHDIEHRHFEHMVFTAKPANVAPKVYGKWMIKDYDYKTFESFSRIATPDETGELFCSNCCAYALFNAHEERVQSRYCPSCGADMRGE